METFPENSRIKSQTKCVFCHKKVFVTEKCFCNRNQSQKEVSVTLEEKKFPSFVTNHMKKFTHFHGTFTEENYFVEPCLDMMYTWEINNAATHV